MARLLKTCEAHWTTRFRTVMSIQKLLFKYDYHYHWYTLILAYSTFVPLYITNLYPDYVYNYYCPKSLQYSTEVSYNYDCNYSCK